eukprot:m51a1_g9891 hypothetical protein (117) ;mRNA; r:44320-44670
MDCDCGCGDDGGVTERDRRVVAWLVSRGMQGWADAYLSLVQDRPEALRGLSDAELADIFVALQSAEHSADEPSLDELTAALGSLRLSPARPPASDDALPAATSHRPHRAHTQHGGN